MNSDEFFQDAKSQETMEPPEGSDDEDSFVVLENSASISGNTSRNSPTSEVLPLFRHHKVREMQNLLSQQISLITSGQEPPQEPVIHNLDQLVSNVSKITISSDSSTEEIQKQVEELIKDNEKLKNTIAQTNVNMNRQYNQFVAYRDDVSNVVKSYKEKFAEAKACIDKVKEENIKLADDIEGYVNIKRLQEEEIFNLRTKVKQQEENLYVKAGDSLLSEATNAPELANANLKITHLEKENTQLREEIQGCNLKITNLEATLKALTQKYDDLKELNSNLSTELSHKKQNVDKLTERLVQSPKFEDQVQSKVEEINVLQFDKTNLQSQVTRLEKEKAELQTSLQKASEESNKRLETISKHIGEIKGHQERIIAMEQELQATRSESNKEMNLLKTRLKEAQKQSYMSDEDHKQLRKQLSIAQQTIIQLEEERQKQITEIEKMRKLLQDSENDEIFALKEQVTLYKNDFEAEQQSKVALKRERDQIAEDLKNLQKRNQQLQNEIEEIRARNQPKPEGYKCPKCDFGFNTYTALENHVHRCLDLGELP